MSKPTTQPGLRRGLKARKKGYRRCPGCGALHFANDWTAIDGKAGAKKGRT